MKTKITLALGLFSFAVTGLNAQVAINNTATNPDASAILDLNSGNAGVNKGFLPPQVALTNVSVAAPVTSPATGLIVYSTSAPAGGNGIGYYYWTGTAWTPFQASGGSVSGSGTATQIAYWNGSSSLASSVNLFWDNANNRLGVGTNAPTQALDVHQNGTPTTASLGASRPVCFVANSPMIGFNAYWGVSNETYSSTGFAGMIEFDQTVSGGFQFMTAPTGNAGNPAAMSAAMSIMNTGEVGIGTSTPNRPLQVKSATAFITTEVDNANSSSYGLDVWASGNNSTGTFSQGTSTGLYSEADNVGGTGVYGLNAAPSGTGNGYGVEGVCSQLYGIGVIGTNTYGGGDSGVGIVGLGTGAVASVPTIGEGVYAEGNLVGSYGHADASSGLSSGGYFDNGYGNFAYVGASNGTNYKIVGPGTVSTLVKDEKGERRVMNCPEAPEILFEDFGTATLSNGKVHISLDPIYAKNVIISEKHPLRVMITLNDQCNGVYVTNRTAIGFDVVELNNGNSNAQFTYEIIANRADDYDDNGKLVSKNADNRFAPGFKPLKGATSVIKLPAASNPNKMKVAQLQNTPSVNTTTDSSVPSTHKITR